ncbi:PucR family transcriptional regulator [Nocardia rhizosphaerihabitans]|uniref:PucR family transcriptional regulator n=1 Tax=Nocardia rhizosphaerihabitans TaxID=1691570 RepID=UPI00367213C5
MATTSSPYAESLAFGGASAAVHLRRDARLSQQVLAKIGGQRGPQPGAVMPCGVRWAEAEEVLRGCLDLIVAALQGLPPSAVPAMVTARIGDWAAQGVALEAVQHATHTAFRFVLDELSRRATSADSRALAVAGQRLAAVLEEVETSFTTAYLRVVRAEAAEHDDSGEVFASALITGAAMTSTWTRSSRFVLSESYTVLALAAEHGVADAAGHREAWLRRLRAELASLPHGSPPALLGVGGGTVLIGEEDLGEIDVSGLYERLRAATTGTPLRIGLVHAHTEQLPEATRQAHELVDLAERLYHPPGVYRMSDLVVEYQITRPGPGRRQVAAVLDPLRDQPELLQTLIVHIRNKRNRRRTARILHLHPNTVDYRLRRIAVHTGLDPATVHGLWYLQAALVASAYEANTASVTEVGSSDQQ